MKQSGNIFKYYPEMTLDILIYFLTWLIGNVNIISYFTVN
jgi:hypothetical protein